MRIALGTDHRGVKLKDALIGFLREAGHEIIDRGSEGGESVDYPLFAFSVAEAVASGEAERGVLICGTGIGMSIAANKVPGIRAALVYDESSLILSRQHNDANLLILPGNWLEEETAFAWLLRWIDTPFEGDRHARRLQQVADYEARD
ncbi:MAG: ribose 5-phosphate isomerase B [Candidatus Krumholzibacteria bacterium]|jgi:ribose 5-phosphate isomerase B|nr:ribose 5-phosphate isomerase B [Candidatus Krumholzibacteria bacterium]MDP6669713.1 ribose 5-phosphate isomerase B [Candidatus Krumholzibacteria bacterium]MDP6798003.1 ribose 5-phosphate isomerase B [Candidatus Krumholzibacteria bacterium]MDP7021268.1 ribose 5-phosphate isomerase B [Candidatus Krumholzibacteria bacterium]